MIPAVGGLKLERFPGDRTGSMVYNEGLKQQCHSTVEMTNVVLERCIAG